jgi:hypothetical protein
MKVTSYVLIVFMTFVFSNVRAQEHNKNLLSEFDGARFYDLFNFLVSKGELKSSKDSTVVLYQRELLNEGLSVDAGIYSFGIPGSHQTSFLYFKCANEKKKFITDYSSDSVLKRLRTFFRQNDKLITEDKKIAYTKAVAVFLYDRVLQEKNRGDIIVIKKKN